MSGNLIIGVGSGNPAKVKAVEAGVRSSSLGMAQLISYNVSSGVRPQPMNDEETKTGALNRAAACVKEGADIGIGLEGGVMEMEDGMYLCNWGALVDALGNTFTAGGARIKLPSRIADGLQAGSELGQLMAAMTDDADVRKKEGAIGIFTSRLINRDQMFLHISLMLFGQYQYSLQEKQS
jgi:inosine/xanthosine triphosphatase